VPATDPNWAEIVTAIATAVGAVGLLFAIVAAFFAAQQVREARRSRHADMAAEFLRRWNDADLVETRRLAAQFRTPEELRAAFQGYIAANAHDAYVLYRELDYFEQLGALEHVGALDFELIKVLSGRQIVERWKMWKPSIEAMGPGVYPMFEALVHKMEDALGTSPLR
jgi:hypothetical protein